jgi:hypothetical protein
MFTIIIIIIIIINTKDIDDMLIFIIKWKTKLNVNIVIKPFREEQIKQNTCFLTHLSFHNQKKFFVCVINSYQKQIFLNIKRNANINPNQTKEL